MFTDCHTHTFRSYCAERDMRIELYLEALAKGSDVTTAVNTDHAMALYFPQEVAWAWKYMTDSKIFDAYRDFGDKRFAEHLADMDKYASKGVVKGLEAEMMHDGRFTFDPAMRKSFDVLIGSVHWLPTNNKSCSDPELITRHWLAHTLQLIDSGIDIIGHPFRWLAHNVPSIDPSLVKIVVGRAKSAGVAVELNSHYKIATDAETLREVLAQGATLALSSDSHRPDEILNLSYHKELMKSLGLKPQDFKLFSR